MKQENPETRAARTGFNLDESPLAALMRRRGKNGQPYLTASEYDAGERLRADYTRAMLVPGLGVRWDDPVRTGGKGGSGGIADLTETAVAARIAASKALDAVGPELAGVLVDVCCFLKGLEAVEFERQWPARSAKLILKTALAALARHYNPAQAPMRRRHHWGAADYRPQMPPAR